MASSPLEAIKKPAYSIQLANVDTWNATAGYNDLGVVVTVSQSALDTGSYEGSLWLGNAPSSAGRANIPSLVALLLLVLLPFLLF